MKRINPQSGLTLIEILVVITIIGIVIGSVTYVERDIVNYDRTLYSSLIASQGGQEALREMTPEIRSAQTSNLGAYALVTASTSILTFYSDQYGNGTREEISYYVSTTSTKSLMKSVITPSGTPAVYDPTKAVITTVTPYLVANSSSTPVFQYYDSSYDGTASTSAMSFPVSIQNVRLIKITLTVDTDPNKSPAQISFTTQVSMRNLKSNL